MSYDYWKSSTTPGGKTGGRSGDRLRRNTPPGRSAREGVELALSGGNMMFGFGDQVKIVCGVSKYFGVVGEVFAVEERSGYVMVDMPKGTELKAEGIATNTIIEQMKAADKKAIKKRTLWPKGDPQWFPPEWLVPVVAGIDTEEQIEATTV